MANYIPIDETILQKPEDKDVIVFAAHEFIKSINPPVHTRDVIIKRFFNCDKNAKANIAREARALSTMKSFTPFLPSFVNYIENAKENYVDLVIEKIEGKTLEDLINNNNLNIDDKLFLFIKICNIVEVIHANKYMHRDLKPQNIVIHSTHKNDFNNTKFIQPYLIDFGSSLLLERYYIGTPRYKAPELDSKKHEHDITYKVDIYSLGVILIRLLTNKNIEEIVPRKFEHLDICDCDESKSKSLDSLIKSMVSQEPKDRPDIKIVISKLWSIIKWKK